MADVLVRICEEKRREVERRRQRVSLSELERAAAANTPRGFLRALEDRVRAGRFGLIAEIKKASPSGGLIRADFDPAALARAYEAGGAACLSVLTDQPFFQGEDAHLEAARAAVALPVLRKDFTLDPYQVVEAAAIGADCVLLIMAALDDVLARELLATAREHLLDVLLEVHDAAELERALTLDARLIGINNRDLRTLRVDLATTEALVPRLPPDRLPVAESGLLAHDDLLRLSRVGARCFLVGQSLMRQQDVRRATLTLLGGRIV